MSTTSDPAPCPHRPAAPDGARRARLPRRRRRPLPGARCTSSELDDHLLRDIGITRADVDAELRRPLRLVTRRSAERIARQLLVGRPGGGETRAVEAEILDGEARRRIAAAEPPPPAPAAPGPGSARAAAPASRAARSAAPAARRRRRARRSRPWPGGGAAPGSRRRRRRPPAAARRRRGRARRAPARSRARGAGGRRGRRPRAAAPAISPRKTSVRCRFSGGTARGTGRPCCTSIRSKRTASGSASAAKARITARARARSTSSSTGGPMPSTMAATPSALGCMPSGWISRITCRTLPPLAHAAEERADVDRAVLSARSRKAALNALR